MQVAGEAHRKEQEGDAEDQRDAEVQRAGQPRQGRRQAHRDQRGRVHHRLAGGAATGGFHDGEHREPGALVLLAEQPGQRQEVRHLPQEHDREQQPRLAPERARRRRPADHRRQGARNGADDGGQRRAALHRRVPDDVADQGGEGHDRAQVIDAEGQLRETERAQQHGEDEGAPCRQPPVGQRPQPRARHQRIDVLLVQLVHHRRPAGHQRRADHRVKEHPRVDVARDAQPVADPGGEHDEHVQPRLGQLQVVRHSARGQGVGESVGPHEWYAGRMPQLPIIGAAER